MEAEERAFKEAINKDRFDNAARLIYADWLDDHDRPEEASNQRNWLTSYKWLEKHGHDWGMSMDELLDFLTGHVPKEYHLGFDTPYGYRGYSDEFWKHFEVISGLKAPGHDDEDRNTMPDFRCAC